MHACEHGGAKSLERRATNLRTIQRARTGGATRVRVSSDDAVGRSRWGGAGVTHGKRCGTRAMFEHFPLMITACCRSASRARSSREPTRNRTPLSRHRKRSVLAAWSIGERSQTDPASRQGPDEMAVRLSESNAARTSPTSISRCMRHLRLHAHITVP